MHASAAAAAAKAAAATADAATSDVYCDRGYVLLYMQPTAAAAAAKAAAAAAAAKCCTYVLHSNRDRETDKKRHIQAAPRAVINSCFHENPINPKPSSRAKPPDDCMMPLGRRP